VTSVYVGTYTMNANGRATGIDRFTMDPTTGTLSNRETVAAIDDPSYLALSTDKRHLYAAVEQATGRLAAFSVDSSTGGLTFLNAVESHGADPCHLSLDPDGRHLLVANYTSGSVAVIPIEADGRVGEATDVVQHVGQGPHPERQAGPHAHMVSTDPTGAVVLVADLGLDRVLCYRLDTRAGKLQPLPDRFAQLPAGAGPRHFAFHPNGRWLFVLGELASTVTVFDYDASALTFEAVQTVSAVPATFTGTSWSAAIRVAPSGRAVYASNRGHDSIAVFACDAASGRLTLVAHTPLHGEWPRDFNIDPDGRFLLAAVQRSHSIATFAVDQATGQLTLTGTVVESPSPVCVLFG
jgi:6-phosphogluconolactonase